MSPRIPAVLSLLLVGLLLSLSPAQEAATSSPASQPAATHRLQIPTRRPSAASQPHKLVLDLGNGVKMQLVLIPAGKFMMGAPDNELGNSGDEGPQHLVFITQPFYMGIYPVTQEQWQAVMGNNPSIEKASSKPVSGMDWDECHEFCRKLSAKTHYRVRLPSEAEWEYACRAGSTTRFYYGDDPDNSQLSKYAWFDDSENKDYVDVKMHPVGQKLPNAWGLYDMHGNTWQLCEDNYHVDYSGAPTDGSAWVDFPEKHNRVLRGGNFSSSPAGCRSASRLQGVISKNPNFGMLFGIRVVAEIPDSP